MQTWLQKMSRCLAARPRFRRTGKGGRSTGHQQWWKPLIHLQGSMLSKQTQACQLLKPSVTHTHTHPSCLPHSAACCTPGAMSNRRVIPGPRCRVGGTSHHTRQPPKHPGQMVCHTSLEERENTDGSWTAPFGKTGDREKKETDRETWKPGQR